MVHPRVCGEHLPFRRQHAVDGGSSPRVRGTHEHTAGLHGEIRFIPACAGNTRCRSTARSGPPVHPRVCGEHLVDERAPCPIGGSSPRVRGTRGRRHRPGRHSRFIPACAGNTPAATRPRSRSAVHPRVCGEHGLPVEGKVGRAGSSPRVRGTLHLQSTDGAADLQCQRAHRRSAFVHKVRTKADRCSVSRKW
jgi:hypothetical protein